MVEREIYKSPVRIDGRILSSVIKELEEDYNRVGATRDTHIGRSKFSAWNNVKKFSEREGFVDGQTEFINLQVVGASKGSTTRIYHSPSVTSLAMPFRKAIVPTREGAKFVFFDIKAAEFFMQCVFCGETEAVNAYLRGEDIYMHYAPLFPPDTERKVIKTILIANMYGSTSYSVAKQLGCTDTYAQRLLNTIAARLPKITRKKSEIIAYARRYNGYFAPMGFDQTNLVKVAEVDPKQGFKPLLALSAYTQSALGLFMINFVTALKPRTKGTILTVFDSLLVEVLPENIERFKAYVDRNIAPFRVGGYGVGDTFLGAKEASE